MVQLRGSDFYCEFLRETSWGTRAATGTFGWFGYITKVTPKSTVDNKEIHALKGNAGTNRRDVQELNSGLEHHAVSIEFLAQTGVVDVLEIGMGATTGPADSLTSITILAAQSGVAEYLVDGAFCNNFEVSCEAGGEVEVSMEFLCKDITETSTLGLDFGATGDVYVHATELTSPVLDFTNCEVRLSGSTLTVCTAFSFKIDNKLEERHYLFGANPELPGDIQYKVVSVTGQITIDQQDNAEWDTLLARANVTIVIVVGAKTFTFNNAKIGGLETGVGPEDLLSYTVPFIAETVSVT